MQSILDIKLKMETQAKQEFAAAQQRLNEEEEKLAALQERRTDYERQARQQLLGTLNCRDMAENKEALLRMDEYIAQQHIQIRKAEEKVEQAREKLAEVMKERKSHETLKDKAFEQFLMDEKKQEGKEVDELTSYTYGQRQKEKAVVEA
jgi:flagellar FliJ protein